MKHISNKETGFNAFQLTEMSQTQTDWALSTCKHSKSGLAERVVMVASLNGRNSQRSEVLADTHLLQFNDRDCGSSETWFQCFNVP